MNRDESIKQLKKLLQEFEKQYGSQIEKLAVDSEKVKEACDKVRESWSGSCFGYHHKLYYGDFERPLLKEQFSVEWGGINGFSDQWQEKTLKQIKSKIGQLVGDGFDFDGFEKDNKQLAEKIEDFQTEFELLVSSITTSEDKHPLKGIGKIEPEKTRKSYLKMYLSQPMMSRDSEAVSQGRFTPAIIYYKAVVYEAESIVSNSRKFTKAARHFIKWCELQGSPITSPSSKPLLTDLPVLHKEITTKCQGLFEAGEYPEAVEKGFKVVRDRLRDLTGHETGSEAFGKGNLHIKGAAAPNVDKDFNEGVKFLTMAIDYFRNEKSHTSNAAIDDPQQAYEYLSLSSLAIHLLDRAEIIS